MDIRDRNTDGDDSERQKFTVSPLQSLIPTVLFQRQKGGLSFLKNYNTHASEIICFVMSYLVVMVRFNHSYAVCSFFMTCIPIKLLQVFSTPELLLLKKMLIWCCGVSVLYFYACSMLLSVLLSRSYILNHFILSSHLLVVIVLIFQRISR